MNLGEDGSDEEGLGSGSLSGVDDLDDYITQLVRACAEARGACMRANMHVSALALDGK